METISQNNSESHSNGVDAGNANNIEDNNNLNEVNTENDDNNEDNDSNDDLDNIFTLMYGREEERDDSEDDSDDNTEDNTNLRPNLNISTNLSENHRKRSSDSVNNSSKRRSTEIDGQRTKRIKSEPLEGKTTSTVTQKTTSIEKVSEDPPPNIPNNSLEFMSYLMDLNANDLELNESHKFAMNRNFQNISQNLRFNDLNLFRNAFIPYILSDLWQKLNYEYNQNHKSNVNVMNLKYFLSILTKFKTPKMKNGLEMKCISVVRPKEGPVFRFGQLITIQTAVQPKPNSSTHIITRRKYFGYITSHLIRVTNPENQSEVNHLRLLKENKKESVIVEEINFMTKYSEELYLRNDALIVAEPIVCVHNSYLEARTIFKFDTFPISKQVFKPIFSSKPSGLSVILNEKKFNPREVETIQIALDVIANDSITNSCFWALNGPKNSQKTYILTEIIRQIVLCQGLNSSSGKEQKKVLFTSPDLKTLKNVEQYLNLKKIRTYFLENDIEKSLKDYAIKHIENKLEKDLNLDSKQIDLYEECLKHFERGTELSTECLLFKYTILEKLRFELINKCQVIIARIEDLCNDIMCYKYFTHSPNHSFHCCIADDSTNISQTKLFSLFGFGINKFLLSGDFGGRHNSSDITFSYGLSRSFFERYYSIYLENKDPNQSTVFITN